MTCSPWVYPVQSPSALQFIEAKARRPMHAKTSDTRQKMKRKCSHPDTSLLPRYFHGSLYAVRFHNTVLPGCQTRVLWHRIVDSIDRTSILPCPCLCIVRISHRYEAMWVVFRYCAVFIMVLIGMWLRESVVSSLAAPADQKNSEDDDAYNSTTPNRSTDYRAQVGVGWARHRREGWFIRRCSEVRYSYGAKQLRWYRTRNLARRSHCRTGKAFLRASVMRHGR
jgi:hypothetical protein